jgi:LmbE family N-acetylglucosaminyl deacetylase
MSINIKPNDKILVVAPHPDDESIGCGGVIALYHNQVDVLLVTDGYNSDLNNLETSSIRQQEFIRAMELAQVHSYRMLHIPEHQIWKNRDKFKNVIFSDYTHIFVPNRHEAHQDHAAVYGVIKKLAGRRTKLYEYEVWTTIRKPNIIVEISSVIVQKQKLITCHASQNKVTDYISLATGLNAYRGQAHGLKYAEAYYCREELIAERIRHLKRKIKVILKR